MDLGRRTAQARSFGRVAAVYAAVRPSYPRAAVDWLVPTGARRVLDLGAGTGKLTALLVAGGLDVVAVDPSPEMLDQLAEAVPGARVLLGTAERIPLPDASVDVVTVAQAWHWVDPAAAVPEVARVLRPGGTLGLVWNTRDESVDWVRELGELMGGTAEQRHDELSGGPVVGPPFGPLEAWRCSWTHNLTAGEVLDLVLSRSYVITQAAREQAETLDGIRRLLDTHADLAGREHLGLPYVTECFRTRLA